VSVICVKANFLSLDLASFTKSNGLTLQKNKVLDLITSFY